MVEDSPQSLPPPAPPARTPLTVDLVEQELVAPVPEHGGDLERLPVAAEAHQAVHLQGQRHHLEARDAVGRAQRDVHVLGLARPHAAGAELCGRRQWEWERVGWMSEQ